MSQNPGSRNALPALLLRFITGDPVARDRLPREVTAQLCGKVRLLAPNLSPDLVDDVVSEVWVSLLNHPPPFDPSRGSAWTYLHLLTLNALKIVRATYAPPGVRKRRRGASTAAPTAPTAELDSLELPDTAAHGRIEAHAQANEVFNQTPRDLRRALWLTAVVGCSLTEVGRMVRQSRFSVARRVERFARTLVA